MRADLADLVDVGALMAWFQVSRKMIYKYRHTYGMPEPVRYVSRSPVWLRSEIEPWWEEYQENHPMPEELRQYWGK